MILLGFAFKIEISCKREENIARGHKYVFYAYEYNVSKINRMQSRHITRISYKIIFHVQTKFNGFGYIEFDNRTPSERCRNGFCQPKDEFL